MAKLTTEEFIKKAREVHGDKYDYSKVEYVNTRTKVCIICPEHGEFSQRPSDHINGHECPQCGKEKNKKSRSKNIVQFVEEARKVHGDKYDYSKVKYVNGTTKVTIICPEHGEFQQRPLNHLNGQGCPQCVGREKLNTKEFIKRAREVHGDKYDYSKVNYVNNRTKVTIICPEHGEFLQRPSGHLSGKGCKKCSIDSNADSSRKTKEWFIEEAQKVHGDKYDYSKVKYVNNATKVAIICPEHGEFLQSPKLHIKGAGCPWCSGRLRLTTEEFIKRAREVYGEKYDYSKVNYVNSRTKVAIICPEHGEFLQQPTQHLSGQGCPQCVGREKLNTKEFIKRARQVHGDKYDYSKVEYVNNITKVIIICPEHGEFLQRPKVHTKGQGCPKCGKISMSNSLAKSIESFLEEAREVHGNKYDYSHVNYVNSRTKVAIICPEHGEFLQQPTQHLSGQGCPQCGGHAKLTTEEFIKKAREVHGEKYDYSKVKYVNNATKVAIICPEHGEFLQRPAFHQRGAGCPQCAGYVKLTTQDFITRAREVHGNKYDYSKVEYTNMFSKVTIICPEHGEFLQEAKTHLDGSECPECSKLLNAKLRTKSQEQFIEDARIVHGDKYDYSHVNYVKSSAKITIICPKHGAFVQTPNDHLGGAGCPVCNESKGEKAIRLFFDEHNIEYEMQKTFPDCKYKNVLPFDFFLPQSNICIEFQGQQHYEEVEAWGGSEGFEYRQRMDDIKRDYCKNNGIRLIEIRYDEDVEEVLEKALLQQDTSSDLK